MESRAKVARNCSGRSDVGGGLKRLVVAGSGGLLWGSLVLEGGLLVGGSLEGLLDGLFEGDGANGVRVSEGSMRGKEDVEKT